MEPAIQDDPNNDDDDDDDDNDELLALQQVTTNDERDTGVMVRVCAVMVGAPWILLVWILLTSPPPPTTTTTTIVNPMRSSDSMDSTSKIPYLPQIGPVREFTLAVTPSISGTDCSEIHVNGYAPECTFPSDYMKKGDDSIHDQEPLLMLTHESGNDIEEESDESASSYRRALEFEQQHAEDEIESINKRFHHSHKEDVPMSLPENQQCSFSDIATRSFGTHYSTGVKKVLLGELEESNDPFQTAAAKIAMLWITSQAPSIFKVMANFRYVDEHDLEFEYNAKLINFIRVERVSNQIHFVFQETSPGIVTEEFLLFLQDQFRGGGASWDEFGDVTQYCAANHGFRDEWDQVMEMPGVAVQGRGLNVNVRVSFLDFKAKSVGIGPQNLRR